MHLHERKLQITLVLSTAIDVYGEGVKSFVGKVKLPNLSATMGHLSFDSLPEPGDRYILGDVLGIGVWAKVYKASDTQSAGKTVAIKVQPYEEDLIVHINEEYRILRDFSSHPNLPDFLGVYRKKGDSDNPDDIWFILEFCEGGSAVELVNRLQAVNRKLGEEHIAYILRETAKGLSHLHKNHAIHRDVRGNNILLTKEGEVKLCDFGLSRDIKTTFGKRKTCIGSPCWMAPEMVTNAKPRRVDYDEGSIDDDDDGIYGSRVDVWALGITAIELGDGAAPFLDMHPTRAMFQIVRNPPPTLYRPANWSQNYNDFIAECLEKNWENRPFIVEILEHPFFTELKGDTNNDHHLSCEIKHLINNVAGPSKLSKKEEVSIIRGYLKKYQQNPEKMFIEDLAALEKVSEETIADEIKNRLKKGHSYTFIGDVLLSLNSNEMPTEFPRSVHNKYICKSRSENSPHIFSVADSAYQDMLHHEEVQHIIFAGESYSGKTTNAKLVIDHLFILGEGNKGVSDRFRHAKNAVNVLVNAGTPLNPDSTRCALDTQMTFGSTGKLSGAIFLVYLLEKLRVSSTDMNQSNFHIFYLFYDSMNASNELSKYSLDSGRSYRYLRIPEVKPTSKLPYIRDDPEGNAERYAKFESQLTEIGFVSEQLETIRKILAAILILGNVRYMDDGKFATIENTDVSQIVAKLLNIDEKKFQWSLENYCVIKSGTAERRKHTSDEARDARDVLAATIYCRLIDWIVNTINQKLAFSRAVFGDIHMITLTDMFGFECFHRNRTEQLMINSLNEQIQYHYNQRMFVWEMMEQEEEEVPVTSLHYYDNKLAVDHLMSKPHGLFYLIDDATRGRQSQEFITDSINSKKSAHIQRISGHEFSVAHYTGKITYDARDLADKNRDFLPPEMVETMRTSTDCIIKMMFTNQLSKTGNLTMAYDEQQVSRSKPTSKSKWGAALVAEKTNTKKLNTLSHGQYSQVHKMRTLSSVFRATSLEILKGLSVGGNSGNTHFVRCIRADLEYNPRGFQSDMVYQQLRALAIPDTVIARQKGYPQRISFQEFLRRYKFLAFDFDENVEMTKDNCRLLLIRLKMEGWIIGKTKVFLKYYNVEYLSRLYETQVKKIVKVQSMMRAFLAKKNVATKIQKIRQDSVQKELKRETSIDEAATTIQKAYRGFMCRQKYGPLLNKRTGKIDPETFAFIKNYAKRWKEKSIFQVLLHYRAARHHDLVNMSQQVHIYNQGMIAALQNTSNCIVLDKIDSKETNPAHLGPIRPAVHKIPFRFGDIPYFDTMYMCDPVTESYNVTTNSDSEPEAWDAPLRRTNTISSKITVATQMPYNQSSQTDVCGLMNDIITSPYVRDPSVPMPPIKRRGSKPPAPLPPEPIYENLRPQEMQKNFEGEASLVDKPNVYKKRAAPKPIGPTFERSNNSLKKKPPPQPNPPTKFESNIALNESDAVKPKLNPVKEMELMSGRNKSAESDDEAPFNFQGMLRKTKYNRASMKRSTSNQELEDRERNVVKFELNNNNRVEEMKNRYSPPKSSSSSNLIYQSNKNSNERGSSGTVNDILRQDDCFNKNSMPSITCSNSSGVYIQEEIHPGIILEGYAIEI